MILYSQQNQNDYKYYKLGKKSICLQFHKLHFDIRLLFYIDFFL